MEERQEAADVARHEEDEGHGAEDRDEHVLWVVDEEEAGCDGDGVHAVDDDGERECEVGEGGADPSTVAREPQR